MRGLTQVLTQLEALGLVQVTQYEPELAYSFHHSLTWEVAYASMEVAEAMARSGLEASVSDAGVAALCARSAVMGAYLNVRINTAELEDQALRDDFLQRGAGLQQKAMDKEAEILRLQHLLHTGRRENQIPFFFHPF